MLRVKDTGLRDLLLQPAHLQTVLTIAERTITSASGYDDGERPWLDACEMGLRLLTEVTLAFGPAPVVSLAGQTLSAMHQSAGQPSPRLPVLSAVDQALRVFQGREQAEKFGYWFLLALLRNVAAAQVDPEVLFRWLLTVWPLVQSHRHSHSKAKELYKLLPTLVPRSILARVEQVLQGSDPNVRPTAPTLPEHELWLQALPWMTSPRNNLRGMLQGKATDGAVRLNAALVLDYASLLSHDSELADEEVRHHVEALDEIHVPNPHGLSLALQLAAATPLSLAQVDTLICLLERGAPTRSFCPAPSAKPLDPSKLHPLTGIVDEFLFLHEPDAGLREPSASPDADAQASPTASVSSLGSHRGLNLADPPLEPTEAITQLPHEGTTSPSDHSRTPPDAERHSLSNESARLRVCRRLRVALGVAPEDLDHSLPPPPPEVQGRFIHYGVAGLVKRLRDLNSGVLARKLVMSPRKLHARQAMLCRALADQVTKGVQAWLCGVCL